MPDESDIQENEDQTLIVPGVLSVSPVASGKKRIRVGPSAGWMIPRGIMQWEHELSFLRRADATPELAAALRGTLPHEQIAPKKFAMASRAALASPLLALSGTLVADARSHGARVYTVGVDRVSSGFYYFAEGGAAEPVRIQGNLIEMLAPALNASTTNAEIEALLEGLIERLLLSLSNGVISELDVELADALPRLSRDGTGLSGTNLEAFDANARRLALLSAPWEAPARKIVDALAASAQVATADVPLYGEARRELRAALEVHVGGKTLHLPEQSLWMVVGLPREDGRPVADSLAPAPEEEKAVPAAIVAKGEPVNAVAVREVRRDVAAASVIAEPAKAPFAAPAPAATLAEPLRQAATPAPVVSAPIVAVAPPAAKVDVARPAAPVAVAPVASASVPLAAPSPIAPTPVQIVSAATLAEVLRPLATPAPEPAQAITAPPEPAAAPTPPETSPASADSAPPETPEDAAASSGDTRPVVVAKPAKVAKKSRPFPISTLFLVAAIVYAVLHRMHWIR